ncbi:hypothetical protein NMY22_g9348 [Coprinellus aureogranulatus]|nr:hypothetical protein NMY22_g9348 [Coprinellus aureogranulatus]
MPSGIAQSQTRSQDHGLQHHGVPVGYRSAAGLQFLNAKFPAHAPGSTIIPFNFIPVEGRPFMDAYNSVWTDRFLVPYERTSPSLPAPTRTTSYVVFNRTSSPTRKTMWWNFAEVGG